MYTRDASAPSWQIGQLRAEGSNVTFRQSGSGDDVTPPEENVVEALAALRNKGWELLQQSLTPITSPDGASTILEVYTLQRSANSMR